MNTEDKLAILAMAARYDVSCSSSGGSRASNGGIGSSAPAGVCHSWSEDGRCISLLKILLSNACIHDCAYCINRRSNDAPRASLTPEEIADLTIQLYKRNYIEGLFLSSGVIKDADYSMELMIKAVSLLRYTHHFNGYIHMKVMPGADHSLIVKAGTLADRISANIELPSSRSLEFLTPDKNPAMVMGSIKDISRSIRENRDTRRFIKTAPSFAPAGQSTQLIVGATPDNDHTILTLSESLYRKLSLKRVYYSAFVPAVTDKRLPAISVPPLKREHRLYQADWLLRFYGFSARELLDEQHPDLPLECDPKTAWALRNHSFFPVEINRATYEEILRIPGVGVKSALRIVQARRHAALGFDELKRIGVVLKRAKYFILCKGKRHSDLSLQQMAIDLSDEKEVVNEKERKAGQLSLFSNNMSIINYSSSPEIFNALPL